MTTNSLSRNPEVAHAKEVTPPVIVPANFRSIRDGLRRRIVANYWQDGRINPSRNAYRPSFEDILGPGGSLGMPLAASYFSSGPNADEDESNIIAFPAASDRGFTNYMQRMGVLGHHAFINFDEFPSLAHRYKRPIYNVDELPEAWDKISANSAKMMRWVNTKKFLNELSSYAAPFEIVDLRTTTSEDFLRVGQGDTVYVKSNNTENSGKGVYPCHNEQEYTELVETLCAEAEAHDLDFDLVLQPRVDGTNQSFQFFMTPEQPDSIQVLTISHQHIAADGKSYLGNDNPPLTPELITPEVSLLMTDMAIRLRNLAPETFGFVMCDYFSRPGMPPLAFDPGLRPTGNTATVLARMFVEQETAQTGFHSSFFVVDSQKREVSFADYIRPVKRMMGPEAAAREGACVMPWGYNHLQGSGLFIAISNVREDLAEIAQSVKDTLSL